MMKKCRAGLLLAILFWLVSSAQASSPIESEMTIQDYFIVFLVGILLVNVFLFILYKILHREVRPRQRSPVAYILGNAVGFLSIVVGSILVILAILMLVTITGHSSSFESAYWFVTQFTFLSNPPYAIITTGALGFLCFLVGAYLFVSLHKGGERDPLGMPSTSGAMDKASSAADADLPLNPTMNFRVVTREDAKPAPDVKVILKKRDNTTFHSKFTDFDGFVNFDSVDGYAQDYYAHVDGDEERLIFRVIQL